MYWFFRCAFVCLFTLPSFAADLDYDGWDDDAEFPPGPHPVEGAATIGIPDMGTHVPLYTTWLDLLGYSYSVIPLDSDYDTLAQYELVLLPFSTAEPCCRDIFVQRAADYHQYVADGGCLYVGQPNPFMQTDPDIPWVPYSLQLDAFYTSDCPRHITNPDHCITKGLSADDFPFPGDTVLQMAPEWEVLVRQTSTDLPAVFTASFGLGNVVVELGAPGGLCSGDYLAGFERMIECCLPKPISIEPRSWGTVKGQYRQH